MGQEEPGAVSVGVDEALEHVGVGAGTYLALAALGAANAADAVEILAVGLLLPAARRELGLRGVENGLVAAAVFGGMLVGGLAWGLAGDVVGRRTALLLALTLNACAGAATAGAGDAAGVAVARLVAGVGIGGSVPVVFAHLPELAPGWARGRLLVALAAHWMLGSLYVAALGVATLPEHWRLFALLAAAPALLAAALVACFVPESPRFLLVSKGDAKAAAEVLALLARRNGVGAPVPPVHTPAAAPRARAGGWAKPLALLARPPLRGRLLALAAVWFGLSMGWYGLVLWLPAYFEARDDGGTGGPGPYVSMLAVACAQVPFNALNVWLVDRVGRRHALAGCMCAGALAALACVAAPPGPGWGLAAACAFNGLSVGGWNTLDLYSAELYPTVVRSSAMGVLGATGRIGAAIGSFAAGALTSVSVTAPMVMGASALLAACAACTQLPVETLGRRLEDDCSEAVEGDGAGVEDDPEGDTAGLLDVGVSSQSNRTGRL